jgi:hypothetical protein
MAFSTTLINEEQNELVSDQESNPGGMTQLRRFLDKNFYFTLGLLCVAIKVLVQIQGSGHAVSYIENDTAIHPATSRPVVLWLHNIAFAAWFGFFVLQTALVRIQKVKWRGLVGWFGFGLGTVMVPLGIATAILKGRQEVASSWGVDAQSNLLSAFFNVLVFGVFFALAVWWRQKPEIHRRLLLIATCGLLYGAFFNFNHFENHFLFFAGVDLVIALGVLRDLCVDRRVHKAYLIAVPALVASQAVVNYMWAGHPTWWMQFAHSIIG